MAIALMEKVHSPAKHLTEATVNWWKKRLLLEPAPHLEPLELNNVRLVSFALTLQRQIFAWTLL